MTIQPIPRSTEMALFTDRYGRCRYNRLCLRCIRPCMQSFRVVVLQCGKYLSIPKNTPKKC